MGDVVKLKPSEHVYAEITIGCECRADSMIKIRYTHPVAMIHCPVCGVLHELQPRPGNVAE